MRHEETSAGLTSALFAAKLSHMRYAVPTGAPIDLPVQPRPASWNKSGDPDQVRLGEFLSGIDRLVRLRLEALPDPLALRLDVGLPAKTPLLVHHDLDNYLLPLVAHLTRKTGRRFASAWATKRTSPTSSLQIARARPLRGDAATGQLHMVRTSASSQSVGFKQQIHDQLSDADPLPEGPVALHLSFAVGPQRNWTNLWKPTIDALERYSAELRRIAPGTRETGVSSNSACTARSIRRCATTS
ncbi:hypothetical protein OG767_16455 [Micromonospora sp. NBC_01392]|uniref:hypothetical protein n=1 Tax=Micromonospora sp. NBC_01392 TaxID=2903588 RepID=UPI003250969B